jgi:hypothetical protein
MILFSGIRARLGSAGLTPFLKFLSARQEKQESAKEVMMKLIATSIFCAVLALAYPGTGYAQEWSDSSAVMKLVNDGAFKLVLVVTNDGQIQAASCANCSPKRMTQFPGKPEQIISHLRKEVVFGVDRVTCDYMYLPSGEVWAVGDAC